MRRISQIEGTIHKGCVFFVPYPEKKRTFLHFFVLTPAFWEFKAVLLHRKSKITVMNDYDKIMESINNTKWLVLGLIWDIIKLIFFGTPALQHRKKIAISQEFGDFFCIYQKKFVTLQRKMKVLRYLAHAEGICLSGGGKYRT